MLRVPSSTPMADFDLASLRACRQRWADMAPQPDGARLCGGCGHLVRDFRRTRDAEIARIRAETPGAVCGIYTDRQLRRGRALPPRPSRWRSLAAAAGVTLAPTAVAAQTVPTPRAPTVQTDAAPDSVRERLQTVLSGRVTDARGFGLPGVDVFVRETSAGRVSAPVGVATDVEGRFRLDLSGLGLAAGETAHVEFGFVGFEPLRVNHPAGVVRDASEWALVEQDLAGDLAFYAVAPEPWSLWGWLRRTLGV